MNIKKIPPLTCKKCGGTHVIMTNNGPECDDCNMDTVPLKFVELSEEVEYIIYETENLGE
jgi:hypothetical protein